MKEIIKKFRALDRNDQLIVFLMFSTIVNFIMAVIKFTLSLPVLEEQQNENCWKYYKTINNINLELNIPNEWKYKEVLIDNDAYEYSFKLYKLK